MTKKKSDDAAPEKEGGRAVIFVIALLLLLVGGGWGTAYAVVGDGVPEGTTISGVDVGGLSPEKAEAKLRRGLADRVEQPMILDVDGERVALTADEAGLEVDYEGSVAEAGGERSWDPRRLWDHFTDGEDLEAIVAVDERALSDALDTLDEQVGTPARDGRVGFDGARVVVTDPRLGLEVDQDAAREALTAAFLAEGEERIVALDLVDAVPEIDEADVRKAVDEFANPAISGAVTLRFGDSPVRLTPEQFSPALALKPDNGGLVPSLKRKRLRALVDDSVAEEGAPVDASVELVDGKPKVIPSKPGVTYRPADIADTLLELVTRPEGEREMKVEATVAEADFTTKEARQLKIREEVSTFTTYYPPATYRDVNIGRAAELIDGTVLKPGETFSLNDTVGERTAENGFTTGTIISNGVFVQDLGGGVSQMATTLFNAAFFAGLEDVEHKPHSVYIDRYPVGREATVAWGAVDLRFKNDTPYGILIDTEVIASAGRSQGTVIATMYSTKVWDIESITGERYNFTSPGTQTLRTPNCMPNTGYGGFDIDVTRVFREHGEDEVHHREVFNTTYIPSDTIICKPPKGN
ncbi:VanW family protein [Nocardioides ferulae]|uniref:VanW family protein n=1 Tax=Nocardioides ferulae TaxID=2340821 RepID=UPI000EAE8412|nr:VanW family protein [Nocardioides ferulae]